MHKSGTLSPKKLSVEGNHAKDTVSGTKSGQSGSRRGSGDLVDELSESSRESSSSESGPPSSAVHVVAKRKTCCSEDCKKQHSKWRILCYVVAGVIILFGTIRVIYNFCAILYFIVPVFPKGPVVFFGGLLDPVSSIFAIITEYSPGFVIILVVNLASKFVFEIGAGTILLYGSLKKRRSFLLCFMRTIYIALFYTLAECVGYTIFLAKGFRMSSAGLGIGKSDSDILSVIFIAFHVITVVAFRMFAFYSALRFRKQIPRVARRVNVRNYFRTHGHLHHDQRYNRRMLIIENN